MKRTRNWLKKMFDIRQSPNDLMNELFDSFFNKTDDIGWDDLRFPAQGVNPTGGANDADVDSVDSPYIGTLLFDNNSQEIAVGTAQMPHSWKEGTSISPHIHWVPTDANAGNVVWKLSYMMANVNGVFSGSYTEDTIIEAVDGNINKHQIVGFTDIDMSDYNLSTILFWRITRVGDSEDDTYDADARLLEFDIHYQVDSLGSSQEYVK